LTLYITPVVYLYFEAASEKARAWRRGRHEAAEGKPAAPATTPAWTTQVPDAPGGGVSFWSSFKKFGAWRK
jgi:hypothetical protein